MKVIYDQETDTLSIILRPGKVAESDEPRSGLIRDYDKAGRLVSMELLDASEQVKAPQSVEFSLAGSARDPTQYPNQQRGRNTNHCAAGSASSPPRSTCADCSRTNPPTPTS